MRGDSMNEAAKVKPDLSVAQQVPTANPFQGDTSPRIRKPIKELIEDGQALVRSLALNVNRNVPVPVDLSEFHKAGGGIKCCTQEIRP